MTTEENYNGLNDLYPIEHFIESRSDLSYSEALSYKAKLIRIYTAFVENKNKVNSLSANLQDASRKIAEQQTEHAKTVENLQKRISELKNDNEAAKET